MEIALLRCSTALAAIALTLVPATLTAETHLLPEATGADAAEPALEVGPIMAALIDAMELEDRAVRWANSSFKNGVEHYGDVTLGDFRFVSAEMAALGEDAISIDLSEGHGRPDGQNMVSVSRVKLSTSEALLSQLLDPSSLSEQGLCGPDGEPSNSALTIDGIKVTREPDEPTAPSTEIFSLARATFALDGSVRGDLCLARAEGSLMNLAVDAGPSGRLSLGEMQIASFRPILSTLPETALGEEFYDFWSVSNLKAAWQGIDDAAQLSFASVKANYKSDSLVALAQSGTNDLIRMAMDGSSEAQLAEAAQPHDLWNAFREVEGDARIVVDALRVKSGVLGLLPAAVLGAKNIDDLTFSGEMSAKKSAGALDYALFQTLEPLAGMGVEAKLELGIAEPVPADADLGQMSFYAPIALKRMDLMVDDKGLDPLLREISGAGLPELIKRQASMLPESQRETVADWLKTAIGEGRDARLRLTPESPVALSEILPLLSGDWTLLGGLLNATTTP